MSISSRVRVGPAIVALAAAGAAVAAPRVGSAAILTVGTVALYANTPDQTFAILVNGTDVVGGANFYAQIGDGGNDNAGTTVAPRITSLTLANGGTIFTGNNAGESTAITPNGLLALDTLATPGTGAAKVYVPDTGVLGYLTVDTTGFAPGTSFTLSLGNVGANTGLGAPAYTTLVGQGSDAPPIQPTEPGANGVPAATIILVGNIVPEPATVGLLATAAVGLLGRRRRIA